MQPTAQPSTQPSSLTVQPSQASSNLPGSGSTQVKPTLPPSQVPSSQPSTRPSAQPTYGYVDVVIVQLLIPVKQKLVTSVSRAAFLADLTAQDKFKVGVVSKLAHNSRGEPFTKENIIIQKISAVSSRRRLQGLPSESSPNAYDATDHRNLAGSLEISYWIALIERNVNPVTYTSSATFATHFAAIVASLGAPEMRQSIEASLATSSTAIVASALAPVPASSPVDVAVVVLQGAPTFSPTSAMALKESADSEDASSNWSTYGSALGALLFGCILASAYVPCREWLKLKCKSSVAVSPSLPADTNHAKLVSTSHTHITPAAVAHKVSKAAAGREATEDYVIEVRKANAPS
jgi:hypothetical protein